MDLAAVQAEFSQFLTDLTSVEKKVIHALTDVARDILRTRPQGAPVVAAVIINRVLQAPVNLKLPTLYLLDSIVKLVGEPYTSYFAPQLPEAFAATWQLGNDVLQRSLQKLYSTWQGVFPQQVLAEVAARVAQLPTGPAQAAPMPAAAPSYPPAEAPLPLQPYQFVMVQPSATSVQPPVAVPAPAVAPYGLPLQERPSLLQQPAFAVPPPPPQQQQHTVLPQPGYCAPVQDYAQLPQPAQPLPALQPGAAPAVQQPVDVANLVASLVNSGVLAIPAATAPPQHAAAGSPPRDATPPAAGTPVRPPEEPVPLEFTPERIKEKNPAAVCRLLEHTEHTKGQFLDRKFLRRQRRSGGASVSRLWYVDLDTWMASTVGAGGTQGAQQQLQQDAEAAAAAAREVHTVPVDDSQTHCALSGERFQQFWDEQHQEWRYRDAKRLDEEEAARYGLQEGAVVLVSTLGAPATSNLLQPATGVLAAMAAEQEVAADLAAAAAAAAGAGAGEAAGGGETKPDVKAGVKHEREEEWEAPAGGPQQQQKLEQKRLRVH